MSQKQEYILYSYTPSLALAVVSIVAFAAGTFIHGFLAFKHKMKFLLAFIIGAIFEAIGYAARAVNANQAPDYETTPYALQSVLILLASSLFAASIYMIFGRIIRLTEGFTIFVPGDFAAFLIQSGGGGMLTQAKSPSDQERGENIIIVGLIVQILFFGFFVIVAVIFHRRITQNPTTASLSTHLNWQQYLWVLYFASLLIMVRCVYRVIEYIQGQTGTLMSHEAYSYVFDALLMLLVVVVFAIFHPSRAVGPPGSWPIFTPLAGNGSDAERYT
ncbi:RTA1 domain-containing protein [Aspergillus undulatus]|uniref:RTA1 domain-containing protein n=1 Tax=Aspergillus undulatus TaxID=1810928 RepID=UPI003CCD4640